MSAIGLPIDLVVEVDVNQSPTGTESPNLRTMLLQGASPVIDIVERIREYANIAGVAADFGTAAPEYLAAALFFAQLPRPTSLFIGRWAKTATSGLLHGGALSATQQLASNFTGITAGAMMISIDGALYYVGGMNFSGVGNMNAVAAIIQTALQASTSGAPTCVWNPTFNRLDITSATAGPGSSVSYASTPTASGNYAFGANPIDGNAITINGTAVTFKNSPSSTQVLIGASLAATLQNLIAFLSGSADTGLSALTYNLNSTTVYLRSKVTGTAGASITITSSGAFAVASGATLSGGSGVDISVITGLTAATGAKAPVPGISAESVTDGIAALDNTGVYWYGLEIVSPTTTAEKLAAAGYIEASKHAYGITSSDIACLDPTSTADIAYLIFNGKYNRTMVQYSSLTPHAVASAFGRMLTVDPTQNASTITLFGKNEPSVQAETLTVTQAAALKAKKCNVFVNYNTGKALIQYGTMGSGLYFDSLYNADTFAANLQVNCFNAITGAATKIPQTDPGNNQLGGVIEQTCDEFVNNGYLAPGTWNAGGVGSIKSGDFLAKGYYVFIPPVSSQSQTDREERKSVPFTILAKEAGAIHSANILVNVNR